MRVAAFQRFARFDDAGSIADSLRRDLAWADTQSVDLAIFPEAYLQGHSYDRAIVARRATTVDSPLVQTMLATLADIRTTAILGFFEQRGSAIFNSAMVVEHGAITGVYAKAHPLEDGCTAGMDFPVWNKRAWRFGINICNDTNHPETAARLLTQGVNLIIVPINNMLRPKKADLCRELAVETLQNVARRTGCWIASADVTGPGNDGWFSYGCTLIARPDGTVVSRAKELAEDVAVFDLG